MGYLKLLSGHRADTSMAEAVNGWLSAAAVTAAAVLSGFVNSQGQLGGSEAVRRGIRPRQRGRWRAAIFAFDLLYGGGKESSGRHHHVRGTVRAPGVVVSTSAPIRHHTLRGATL